MAEPSHDYGYRPDFSGYESSRIYRVEVDDGRRRFFLCRINREENNKLIDFVVFRDRVSMSAEDITKYYWRMILDRKYIEIKHEWRIIGDPIDVNLLEKPKFSLIERILEYLT